MYAPLTHAVELPVLLFQFLHPGARRAESLLDFNPRLQQAVHFLAVLHLRVLLLGDAFTKLQVALL